MRSNIISNALALGYDDTLYRPLPKSKTSITYGLYIKRAQELLQRGLISDGKYEELLLEAIRTDLVYGLDERANLIERFHPGSYTCNAFSRKILRYISAITAIILETLISCLPAVEQKYAHGV